MALRRHRNPTGSAPRVVAAHMGAMSTQTAAPAPVPAAEPTFHRIDAPLNRDQATSLVAPDGFLRVIVTLDPHELVTPATQFSTELPELDVLAGYALRSSEHGLVVPCHGSWQAVGYAGDGLIEVAFAFDYFASVEDDDYDARVDAMYCTFVADVDVEEPLFEDVPLPGLESSS